MNLLLLRAEFVETGFHFPQGSFNCKEPSKHPNIEDLCVCSSLSDFGQYLSKSTSFSFGLCWFF